VLLVIFIILISLQVMAPIKAGRSHLYSVAHLQRPAQLASCA